MKIIEIIALENGAHRNNESASITTVPKGWAVIPEDMECESFPFGEVEVAEIDGVMTVTKWTAGKLPEPENEELTPSQKREEAYNSKPVIEWGGETLTVTQAATMWQYYAAEGNAKADELTVLIAAAKQAIRDEYPEEGEGVTA